jgi:hypothetical protein
MTRPPAGAAGRAGKAETAGARTVLAWLRSALVGFAVAALMLRLAVLNENRVELAAAAGAGLQAGWSLVAAAWCHRRPGRSPHGRRRVQAATLIMLVTAGATLTAVL